MSTNRNLSNTGMASLAALSVGIACVCAASGLGPLTPPSGPVASTAKPLSEVEPRIAINATNTPGDNDASPSLFKITQPGSYYLTGNIQGVAGKHGIEIASGNVTLDLNGFELVGSGNADTSIGINCTSLGAAGIVVRNGELRNWGGSGVDLNTATTFACRVDGLLVCCSGGSGIAVRDSTIVTNCSAILNQGNGFTAGIGCTLTQCAAQGNTLSGIVTNTACTLAQCTARGSTQDGFALGSACTISGCTATGNTGRGIFARDFCTLTNCTSMSNTQHGIVAQGGCVITSCTSSGNGASGFNVESGCSVVGCAARENQVDGVRCTVRCFIQGNTAEFNGQGDGAGIHATGSGNRIEGNNCTSADRGIAVDLAGNIIIKNTCAGNGTNWVIAVGNSFGPIVVTGTNAAAISTNGAVAGTVGSTDPNANFSY